MSFSLLALASTLKSVILEGVGLRTRFHSQSLSKIVNGNNCKQGRMK